MWPVANYVRQCKDYMFGTSAERPALVYSEKMFKKMCVGGHGTWDAGGGGEGARQGNVDGEGARVGTGWPVWRAVAAVSGVLDCRLSG